MALKREVASLKEKIGHLESVLKGAALVPAESEEFVAHVTWLWILQPSRQQQ